MLLISQEMYEIWGVRTILHVIIKSVIPKVTSSFSINHKSQVSHEQVARTMDRTVCQFFAGLSIERLELTLTCYDPNLRIPVKRLVL